MVPGRWQIRGTTAQRPLRRCKAPWEKGLHSAGVMPTVVPRHNAPDEGRETRGERGVRKAVCVPRNAMQSIPPASGGWCVCAQCNPSNRATQDLLPEMEPGRFSLTQLPVLTIKTHQVCQSTQSATGGKASGTDSYWRFDSHWRNPPKKITPPEALRQVEWGADVYKYLGRTVSSH